MIRRAAPRLLAAALLAFAAEPSAAESVAFDLKGPSLAVTVSRAGAVLPLAEVPALAAGDRIAVVAPPPPDRGSRYYVVLAFLRGATSPPPADWIIEARPWEPKHATIDAAVPAGAEQALVLLVPETGGAIKAVRGALGGRAGAFVRAVQELTQASLDRARLDAYLRAARAQEGLGPTAAADAAPALARSLQVKVDGACLVHQPEVQAACLAQGGGAAVLADAQTSSLAQNLAGAPADVALAVSSTPQASFGYYSPYIGLVRDLARIFGAFQSAQLQFIPALEVPEGAGTRLFLNTPPSFRRPQSVLVAPLPAVAPARPPVIVPAGDGSLCAAHAPLVAGFTGAPLLYATGYARDMRLRVRLAGGETVELPVAADPLRGGYVVQPGADPAVLARASEGVLHGLWGFDPFEGSRYTLVAPTGADWRVADRASLVVGRDSPLPLEGGAAACVTGVAFERDGEQRPVAWSASGERGLALKVPLDGTVPGPATLLIASEGRPDPQRLTVRTYSEPSRLSAFTVQPGEHTGVLAGTRLDQVASLTLDGIDWRPDALGRVRSTDRLDMVAAAGPAVPARPGEARQAKVTLVDGRTASVKVVAAPPGAAATLVSRSIERPGPARRPAIAIDDKDVVPADARLTFSIRAPEGVRFAAGDQVEVAAGDAGASVRLPLRLQDASVALAELVPATALGPAGFGPARFRLIDGNTPADWRPLGTIVRLPRLDSLRCAAGERRCTLQGDALFLLRSVSAGGESVTVEDGFTGDRIAIPRSANGRWKAVLRDAPADAATIEGG